MVKMIFKIFVITLLLGFQVSAETIEDFSLFGRWKLLSYQLVVDSPPITLNEAQNWIGRWVEFTEPKRSALIENDSVQSVCPHFDYQVEIRNAKEYFEQKYQLNPLRLGILTPKIEVITLTCKVKSWFGIRREFIKVSEEQMLADWEGLVFFFFKPVANKNDSPPVLLMTPQSLGTLNSNSDFDPTLIAKGLQCPLENLKTNDSKSNHSPSSAENHLEYFQENKLLLEIYPHQKTHKIASIHILDNSILASNYALLGQTYSKLLGHYESQIDCRTGVQGEHNGQTLCYFKEIPSIEYVFKPLSNAPPIEALEQAKLVELVWLADKATALIMEQKPEMVSQVIENDNPLPNNTSQDTQLDDKTSFNQTQEYLLKKFGQFHETLVKFSETIENPEHFETQVFVQFIKSHQAWKEYEELNCQWLSTLAQLTKETTFSLFNCRKRMAINRTQEIENGLNKLQKK